MSHIKRILLIVSACWGMAMATQSVAEYSDKFRYPFYIGATGGYGSTTWEGLVPSKNNQNDAMSMSVPKYVQEGGAVWGVFAGYEFIPYFALEASYMRYPNAKVSFDEFSLYAFNHNGYTELNTHTDSSALMAKIMLVIPHTTIRAYSSVGAAATRRWDELSEHWRVTPTFGAGFNYNFTDHIMGELGATYTAGYGESQLNPAENYLPFLYSAFLRLAYRL